MFILYLNIGNWNHIRVRIRYFATRYRNFYDNHFVYFPYLGSIFDGKIRREILDEEPV